MEFLRKQAWDWVFEQIAGVFEHSWEVTKIGKSENRDTSKIVKNVSKILQEKVEEMSKILKNVSKILQEEEIQVRAENWLSWKNLYLPKGILLMLYGKKSFFSNDY